MVSPHHTQVQSLADLLHTLGFYVTLALALIEGDAPAPLDIPMLCRCLHRAGAVQEQALAVLTRTDPENCP